ncbi:hypothetical protein [Acaryochloris sp. IP29b_bin.137]|uniref:hypothetical protein n=1 Tax=Acaryochloris sp. IP29b_bin.137 TaxID=2969217 RepID=UPI00261328C2|nr:hypothetical protein [Acaryochloris sp. IP29b_bin.137]
MTLKNIKWPNPSGNGDSNAPRPQPDTGNTKWRTMVGLLIIYAAAVLNWQWIWGVFSLYWIIPDFFTGVTYFIEPIARKHTPILYWLIMITWVAFSVVMFFPSVSAPRAA